MALFIGLSILFSFLGIWTVSKKEITHLSRESSENIFLSLAFLIMLVITGCRGLTVGNDTPMYVRYFTQLRGLKSLSLYNWRYELGFRFFNCLVAQFFSDPHVLLFMAALVTFILLFYVIKKGSAVPVYSILLFYALTMYYTTINMVRQYIAISICCLAILLLMEKKRIRFVLLVILAGLMHTSAYLVMILIIFSIIPYNKNKRYWYILLGLVCSAFFGGLITIMIRLFPAYSSYLTGDNYYLQGKLGSIIRAVIYGMLFWIYDYLYRKYGKDTEANKIMYFTAILGFFISFVSVQGAILSRIAYYFNVMFCVSIPNALSWIPDRKKKYVWAAAILLGAFAYNIIILIFRPNWSGVIPYSFWNS